MRRRRFAAIGAGVATVAVGAAILFGSSTGGSIDVIIGGTPTPTAGPSCTTTLSGGGSIASALSSATAGSTICLNAALNWTFNATVSKSSMTKVTLAGGVTQSQVRISSLDTNASNNLWFDGMTIGTAQASIDTGSTNLKFTNIKATGPTCIQAQTSNANILLDHWNVTNVGQSCTEGSIGIQGTSAANDGITISNSEFNGGNSDAIQVTDDARGVTIGPGNYIHDKTSCSVHCDAIQPYGAINLTVTGNYLRHNDGNYSDFDCNGSDGLVFTNNVVERGDSAQEAVVLSGANTATITHNTLGYEAASVGNGSGVTELQIYAGNTPGATNSCGGAGSTNTNITVKDNILADCETNAVSSTLDYNLTTVAACRGTHGFNGSATFTQGGLGGVPTTFGGYLLTSGSLGHLGGDDGTDVGAPVATMTGVWP